MEREKHKILKFQGAKSELISILKNVRFTRRTHEHRNFPSVFGDRTSFLAKGLSRHTQNRNFIPVFGDRRSFLAKGLRPTLQNGNFTSVFFWRSNIVSRERVVAAHSKSQFNFSFCDRSSFLAKGLRPTLQNRSFTSVFRAKGLSFHFSFWRSKLVSSERITFRAVSLALPRTLREK